MPLLSRTLGDFSYPQGEMVEIWSRYRWWLVLERKTLLFASSPNLWELERESCLVFSRVLDNQRAIRKHQNSMTGAERFRWGVQVQSLSEEASWEGWGMMKATSVRCPLRTHWHVTICV
jgi:hypothetical protein